MKQQRKALSTALAAKPAPAWTQRSKRVEKKAFELGQKVARLRNLIHHEETRLATAETNRKRQLGLVETGQLIYQRNLQQSIAEIKDHQGQIAAYQGQIADYELQIEALKPPPEQVAERTEVQNQLARIAQERLGRVAAIDRLARALGKALEGYQELTAQMRELGAKTDLEAPGDYFDQERFDALQRALPGRALATESLRWSEWFLGVEADRQPCEIVRDTEEFRESLASAGFFVKGETPRLNAEQRQQALGMARVCDDAAAIQQHLNPPALPEPEPTSQVLWQMMR
jgi:hypothetical protein